MRNQKIRKINGRYEEYPHCYVCNKPIEHYFSHPLTDCDDINGKHVGDLLLVLCPKCYNKTENLTSIEDILKFASKK